MKNKTKDKIITLAEGSAMVALAVILDLIMKLFPGLPQGGSISVSVVPIVYYAYRRGTRAGVMAGFVWAVTQMLIGGFYPPPANNAAAVLLCLVLDYLLAFTVAGIAPVFARLTGKRRIAGYSVGTVAVCLIRFVSSALSGALLWGSYAPEGMNVWAYTVAYNASYMIPNTVLAGVIIIPLCLAVDPLTLRPHKWEKD